MPCIHCKNIKKVMAKCKTCAQSLCNKCSIIIYGKKFCESCAIKQEFDNLFVTISDGLKHLHIPNQELIVKLLTNYSIGYVFKCCNECHKCTKAVIIDNIVQFKHKKDSEGKNIYYYPPKYYTNPRPTISIQNKKYRIFCNFCKRKRLSSCTKCYEKQEPRQETTICGLHVLCFKCSKNDTVTLCGECKKLLYCPEHGYKEHSWDDIGQCEECAIRVEYREKRRAVSITLNKVFNIYHEFIINMITEYSMGYIIMCTNNELKEGVSIIGSCSNDIIWDNKWQCVKGVDYKGDVIHYWGSRYTKNDYYKLKGNPICLECHVKRSKSLSDGWVVEHSCEVFIMVRSSFFFRSIMIIVQPTL
eukprot:455076_1